LFFVFLCTSYVASFSGLSFCFSSSCVPPMLHKMKKNKTKNKRQHRGYTR
jgi:hypothetical protein